MKRLASVLLLALCAVSGRGQTVQRGTTELGVSGFLDFATVDGTTAEVDLSWGRFVRDYWELGARGGVALSDSITRFSTGVFTEYNIELGRTFLPFIGLSLSVLAADVDLDKPGKPEGSDAALGAGVELGSKGFLSPSVALSGGLVMEWATDDIFLEEDDVSSTDVHFRFGLRCYF